MKRDFAKRIQHATHACQKFFENPEGQKEFEEWKAQRAKEVEKERKRKERMTKVAVSLTIPTLLL